MKISTNMLSRYFKRPLTAEQLFKITNEYITEVESLTPLLEVDNLVVGYVKSVERHQNAEKLFVCQVDVGENTVEQIVCGADNVRAGQYVCVAKVGAVLPGDFEIKAVQIRGVQSNGMICSLEELGFDEKLVDSRYQGGIYYFDEPKEIGSDAVKALNLAQFSLELDLTPNRTDLLSVLGFAYDLGAAVNEKVTAIEPEVIELGPENPLKVIIEDQGCLRYYARYLDNIKVKPSPMWLQADLIASGIRPINNVVDVTNYVLLELGTPLHAFDADKFATDQIVVRKAKDLEEVITLDEQIRILKTDDIVITNGNKTTAIGGVMGLLNTAVDSKTTKIILEAATFDSTRIRQTSRRLDLVSDSSIRFERGIDELRVRTAINRAAELLVQVADARVYKTIKFAGQPFDRPTIISLTAKEVNKYLGTELEKTELKSILKRLNIIEAKPDSYLIPSYRNDVKIKADLIEEVARIYGYNNIPTTLPKNAEIGGYTNKQLFIKQIRKQLKYLGFNEAINYSLTVADNLNLYQDSSQEKVKLVNPLRDDRVCLRQSLINGLVDNVKYHLSRQHDNLKFFEVGSVYYRDYEPTQLAAIINGKFIDGAFTQNDLTTDFYLIKGILENIFKLYEINVIFIKVTIVKGFHPGIAAKILLNDEKIGFIGKIHPAILIDSYAFEVDLDKMFNQIEPQADFKTISRFPSISRDLAVVIDKNISAGKIIELLKQTTRKYLTSIKVFDRYEDVKLGEDKISLAFRLTFNAKDRTLETNDVDKLMKSVVFRLEKELKAEIRQ